MLYVNQNSCFCLPCNSAYWLSCLSFEYRLVWNGWRVSVGSTIHELDILMIDQRDQGAQSDLGCACKSCSTHIIYINIPLAKARHQALPKVRER